jgi:hypothetical protein
MSFIILILSTFMELVLYIPLIFIIYLFNFNIMDFYIVNYQNKKFIYGI